MALSGKILAYDVDDCRVKLITSDTDSALTHGTVYDAPGIQEFSLDVSMVEGESYGDGRILDQFSRTEKVSGSCKLAKLSHELFAAIFSGQSISSGSTPNQKLQTAIGPQSLPYFEIDCQTLYTGPDGVSTGDAHCVVHKCKVKSFKVGRKSKEYQEVSFEFEGIPLNYQESGWNFRRCLTFEENETSALQTLGAGNTNAPTFSTTPADDATGVVVTADLTAVSSIALQPSSVSNSSVQVMTQAGVGVAGAVSLSTNGLTITFNPTASLSASTGYLFVLTQEIRTVYGVQPAANTIVSFTTA